MWYRCGHFSVIPFQMYLSSVQADGVADLLSVSRLCFVKLNLILLGIELQFGSRGER